MPSKSRGTCPKPRCKRIGQFQLILKCFSLNLRVSFYNQVTTKAASTGLRSQPRRPASLPPREGGPAWVGQWASRTGDLASTPIGPFPWEVQQRQVMVIVPSAWPLRSLGGGQAQLGAVALPLAGQFPSVQFQRRGPLFRQALLVHTGPSRPPPWPSCTSAFLGLVHL